MTLQLMIEVNEMTRNLPLCNLGNSFLLHSTKLSSTSGPTDGSLDNCLKTHSVKTYHHCLLRFPRAVGTGGQGRNRPPLHQILADHLTRGQIISSIFLLVVNLGIDSITAKPYIPQRSWFQWICSKFFVLWHGHDFFDLHGYGGCYSPKTLLRAHTLAL